MALAAKKSGKKTCRPGKRPKADVGCRSYADSTHIRRHPRTRPFACACGKATPTSPKTPTGSGAVVESLAQVEAKATAGDAGAQFDLGAMYHDGQGTPKDFAKAKMWFEKAAASGDIRAESISA